MIAGKNVETDMIDKQGVIAALKNVHEPKLKKDLVELGMIRNVLVDGGRVKTHSGTHHPALSIKKQHG